MKIKIKIILCLLLLLLLAGCASAPVTTFTGDARIKGGPLGCEAKCNEWGMELAGMVALGEYTDGCICRKKGLSLSIRDVGETLSLSLAGSSGGAIAAVESKHRDLEAKAAAADAFFYSMPFH